MTREEFEEQIDKYGKYSEEFINIERNETLLEKCWKISVFIGHLHWEKSVSQEVSFGNLMMFTSNFIAECFAKAQVSTQCKLLKGVFNK